MYIDTNKLANVRRDVIKKKRLTGAVVQEIKTEVKTITKKPKKKVVATEQPESESEDKKTFLGFDNEGIYYVKRVKSGSRRLTL